MVASYSQFLRQSHPQDLGPLGPLMQDPMSNGRVQPRLHLVAPLPSDLRYTCPVLLWLSVLNYMASIKQASFLWLIEARENYSKTLGGEKNKPRKGQVEVSSLCAPSLDKVKEP